MGFVMVFYAAVSGALCPCSFPSIKLMLICCLLSLASIHIIISLLSLMMNAVIQILLNY